MSKINGNIIQNNLRADVLDKASKILDNKSSIDFSSKINNAIKEVADSQTKANQITKDYEFGKETDLTKVVMQQQVANIAFQLTLNVRNKVLSSYKDIMNMPV
jgi:flagellar hook-basal body complex protein FliE